MKKIINKVNNLKTFNFDEISNWEFNQLKDNADRNVEKLVNSIKKGGFTDPFFVWNRENKPYVIDGEGRRQAILQLIKEGYEIPELPVLFIEAKNLAEAKKNVLRKASTYGKITQESQYSFVQDIPEVKELTDQISYYEFDLEFAPIIPVLGEDEQGKAPEKTTEAIVFHFDTKIAKDLKARLNNARERLRCDNNEDTLIKLLENFS